MMFEQTTIGNLGAYNVTTIDYHDYIPILSGKINKADMGPIFSGLDLFGALLFLLFLKWTKGAQKKVAQAADDAITTVADYSLRISKLPKDALNREELQVFFEKRWGPVADVAM